MREGGSMKTRGTTRENVLYGLNLLVSLALVYALYAIIAGASEAGGSAAATGTLVITYVVIILLYVFFAKGILIGRIRGNGIRVSASQFPEIYSVYRNQLAALGLRGEPSLYCVQSNGVLNAFATRMLFRNYVVMYSEVLEAAYEAGEDAVAFVLAHELGHVKRMHLLKNFFIFPAFVVLPLRFAYSRACEYTCDRIGRSLTSARGIQGLVLLAAGRRLGARVNIAEYLARAKEERGFWVWFAEVMSTHPNLPKRIARVQDAS
jgi:Zn-dependent protease with chaperone function